MVDKRRYTKAELKKLYTNLRRKGITDDMAGILIEHCYNQKTVIRTSGFYYAEGPDAVIAWDDATRTFTITPFIPSPLPVDSDGKEYDPHIRFFSWENGPVLHRKYAAESIQLPNEEGLFAIYLDANPETRVQELVYKKNPTETETQGIYEGKVLIAWFYWDVTAGTAIYFGDSRHGSEWNPQIHWSWHQTLNSVRQEGIAIVDATYDGDGSENAHYQFGISEGKLWHEDILDSTEAVGLYESVPVWYFNSSGLPRYTAQSGKKFLNTGSGRVAFNPPVGGGLTEATTDYYVLYHLFATNCRMHELISVMGRAEYQQLGQAIAAINAEVADLRQQMPHSNLMWIDTIIIQTSDDYTNAAKARIVTNACNVLTEMSVVGDGSTANKIKLKNDEDEPGVTHYYGTDETETKGYHPLPEEDVQELLSPSDTFDMEYGRGAIITLTADTTITFANLKANDTGHIEVSQGTGGGHSLSFSAPTGVAVEIAANSYEAPGQVKLTGMDPSKDVVVYWFSNNSLKIAVVYNVLV